MIEMCILPIIVNIFSKNNLISKRSKIIKSNKNMKFKRIIALIAIAFGAFFTAMMLLNVWSTSFQANLDSTLIGKLMLTSGMLSVAFIALLVALKLMEEKK